MKRRLFVILALFIVLSIFFGCQKTPENPFVSGKNLDTMLDKAIAETEQKKASDNSVDLYARLDAPQTYATDITSKMGGLTVHVDANVVLPTCELPIVRVKKNEFAVEQVKTFSNALFGSDAKYIESNGADVRTKEYCQRMIEELRWAIDNYDAVGNLGKYDFYGSKEAAEQGIADLMQEAATAPETLPSYMPDYSWEMATVSTGDGTIETTDTYMMLTAMPNNRTYSLMSVSNSMEWGNSVDMWYERDTLLRPNSTDAADVSGVLTITQDQAYRIAMDTLEKMQIDGLVCSGKSSQLYDSGTRGAFEFMFTRQFGGVVETYTNADASSEMEYSKPWEYEKLRIFVDDEGVLYVRYSGPCKIVETVADTTTLMPFSDIRDVFEKMVVIVDNIVDTNTGNESTTEEYFITEVRLGLMCIREQNKDTGLLIPVWDFMGYKRINGSYGGRYSYASEINGYKSLLTINAVDGSIVVRDDEF